jgi:glyoxylase-like metal-dependent hydrolase (beta-lactamase superfamily II)
VRFVINTHYHFDHTDGNGSFQKEAPVIAHDNVRKRLESGGTPGNLDSVKQETKPATREAPARAVLEMAMKSVELEDLAERVKQLEALLEPQK